MKPFVCCCCVVCFFPFAVMAKDGAAEAQRLLRKMHNSAQNLSYSGVFVFQQDDHIITSRITHDVKEGIELEKLEVLDGRPREYFRRNDRVMSYQPDRKLLRDEKRQVQYMFPAVLAVEGTDLAEYYTFRLAQLARIAGVECRVVLVEPKDKYRYGYRFCAAIPSGLMLQAQVNNAKNHVLEQVAFTTLVIGAIDNNELKPTYPNTKDWKMMPDTVTVTVSSGWRVMSAPVGFKKIREIKRSIHLNPEEVELPSSLSRDRHQVNQLVFSDGLAAVSVFVEPFWQKHHAIGTLQQGATTILTRQQGDYWITVVGEVPPAAIQLIANSINYKP